MTFDVIPDEPHEEPVYEPPPIVTYGIVAVLVLIIVFTYRWILKTEARQRKERLARKTTAIGSATTIKVQSGEPLVAPREAASQP